MGQDCVRKSVKIDGENFYLVVGSDFVQVTVPRENDPTQSKTRKITERLCQEITGIMKKGKEDDK